MSRIETLKRERGRFVGALELAKVKGSRRDELNFEKSLIEVDRRIARAEMQRESARNTGRMMEDRARRVGKSDAVAAMCRRGRITAVQARAAEALRGVVEAAITGPSPMAALDGARGSGAPASGVEPVYDAVRLKLRAEAYVFDPVYQDRHRHAVRLVVIDGLSVAAAMQRSGIAKNGRAGRAVHGLVIGALDRSVEFFRISV